jgi:chromosome segregation ATPase
MRADFQQIRQMMNEDLDKLERNMTLGFEKGNERYGHLERDHAASERAVKMLTAQVEIAQRREKELLEQNASLNGELARLNAKLQGIRDQIGGDELPMYTPRISLDPGQPHKAVVEDIRESAGRLAGMDAVLDGMERELRRTDVEPVESVPPRGRRSLLNLFKGDPNEQPAVPLPEFPEEPRRVEA